MLLRVGGSFFSVDVTGRAADPSGCQQVVSLMLASSSSSIQLAGAFQFGGGATIGDGGGFNGGPPVTIDGNDNVPPGWESTCPPPGPPTPGLVVEDIAAIDFTDSPDILGSPPFVEAPFEVAAFDAQFDALVAQATITFPPGMELKSQQIVPSESPPGVCDTSDKYNWGAPEDPTHPCFDYFPIIYVPAGINFKNQPDHSGEGILLMDTGAQLENGFSWYGPIMSRDDIQIEQGKSGCEPANVYGGLITRNAGSSVKLWGPKWFPGNITCNGTEAGSSLFYSSCVMDRIGASLGGSSGVQPLSERGWRQRMD